jgi:hypothetical protein
MYSEYIPSTRIQNATEIHALLAVARYLLELFRCAQERLMFHPTSSKFLRFVIRMRQVTSIDHLCTRWNICSATTTITAHRRRRRRSICLLAENRRATATRCTCIVITHCWLRQNHVATSLTNGFLLLVHLLALIAKMPFDVL